MRSVFHRRELDRLPAILAQAEDLTGSYFKLSSFDPSRFPFELATLRDLDHREIAPRAFAQLARYEVENRTRAGRGLTRPFYRICLQDHNLLQAVRREGGALSLEPLLLYVLTHELCHIVRFCRFQKLFEADGAERDAEEKRVHSLTHEILAPVRDPLLRPVLERFGREPLLA
jgi:hypothetical protein